MEIIDHLLVRDIINPERQSTLVFAETSIVCGEQVMAVWRKQSYHWKVSKEVGDGMSVVLLHERPFVIYDLDIELFEMGLSVYQEYDESANQLTSYLYGYPKGNMETLNTLLDAYSDEVSAVHNRFVQLSNAPELSDGNLEKALHKQRVQGALSFIFGLSVAYGQYRGEGDILHNVHIQLPLVGSIVQYRDLIVQSLGVLIDHGMYSSHSESHTRDGAMLEIHIQDWEILYHLAKWIQPAQTFATISRHELNKEQKQHLLDFVESENTDTRLLERIGYSVLKMLTK